MSVQRASPSKLELKIAELGEEMRAYSFELRHYVSDTALFGFALDVLEQAKAVAILCGSDVPRTAFSNARSAFESAQDVFLLTSDAEVYDRNGCLAAVHEAYDTRRLQARFQSAEPDVGLGVKSLADIEGSIEEDAAAWDGLETGCGDKLRSALSEFKARHPQQQKHWTGLTRREIGERLGAQLDAGGTLSEVNDAMYGSLSSHSHPRMRMSQRQMEEREDGAFVFVHRSQDRSAPATAATFACILTIEALRRRRGFFKITG